LILILSGYTITALFDSLLHLSIRSSPTI